MNEQEKSGPASGVPTIIDQYITCRLQGRQENVEPGCLTQCCQWELWPLANTRTVPCLPSRESGSHSPIPTRGVSSHANLQHFDCCDGSFLIPVRGFVGHDDTKVQHHSNLLHTYIHTYLHTYLFVCPSTYLPSKPTLLRSYLEDMVIMNMEG